jgi:hypothetical protein
MVYQIPKLGKIKILGSERTLVIRSAASPSCGATPAYGATPVYGAENPAEKSPVLATLTWAISEMCRACVKPHDVKHAGTDREEFTRWDARPVIARFRKSSA